MSGFEVAGIVLAAFPLAISALNKYREVATRLGLFYKIQLEHKKWLDDLEFHQLLFSRHLRQLVLPLVVDDDKIKELLSNPRGDGWRDRNIAAALASRLGDSYELYFKYVSGVKGVVDDINHELAVDQKPVQEKLNHLVYDITPLGVSSASSSPPSCIESQMRGFESHPTHLQG